MNVVEATRADLDALHVLAIEMSDWTRESLLDAIDRSIVLVARDEDVIGFAIAHAAADEAELLLIGVARSERRRGIGKKLLEAMVEKVRARGARAIHLEVRSSNQAAIALYASLGFAAAGTRRRYYSDGEDALLMRRALPQNA